MPTLAILLRSGVGDIILGAGLLAKVVLAILALLSVVSWAITVQKIREFRAGARQNQRFLGRLPESFSILEAGRYTRGMLGSGHARLLVEASASVHRDVAPLTAFRETHPYMIAQSAKKAMERKGLELVGDMERNLSFLATTASVSPFLGLFGTVWGVMNSFLSMGQMGSASLTVVGSGVAEALITTVFGLGAAIPALVSYNYLVNIIRRESSQMEAFISLTAEGIEKEIQSELVSSKISV
jgi:biopolymer transport protein TolQ